MSEFALRRLGMLMEPEPGNPLEVEGVLNPAAVRGPDGELYLFPRMVAKGNYSRIGIARVRFNEAGDPVGVERLGIALEPEADYDHTLAALNYEGQGSVSRAISDILNKIVVLIDSSWPRIIVLNPAHTEEDLSERWENPVQYAAFVTGIRELNRHWADLMAMSGIQNVSKALEKLFGEPAMVAVAAQANRLQQLREEKSLRVMPAGLISAAPAIGLAMRSNTFHGN